MEPEQLKLAEGVTAWRQVDGETIVLDLTESAYLGVNSAGSKLWQELAVGTTVDNLVALLTSTYGLPLDRARRDVDEFIATCRERGYLR